MKLLQKKKYKELIDKLDYYKSSIKVLDNCICKLRQQKYDLEIMNNNQEQYIKALKKELASQKRSNRRLINLLYNPKKK